jgi:heme-degrading monooxygenase HmoA
MIVRTWRGWSTPANVEAYARHLTETVLPELKQLAGFLGVELLRREDAGRIELQVQTRWESMAAIRAFAGEDPGHAVVEPQAQAVLIDYETRAVHFEVVVQTGS